MREAPASLDFGLTPVQEQLRRAAQAYIGRALTPELLRETDIDGRAPMELLPGMAAEGFIGLPVPSAYGGSDGGAADVSVLLEEFGRASLSIASFLNRALGWGVEAILRFGTEEQKRRLLPRVCAGELMFAFSHTEADAGSDAAAIRTRAVADGDDFVINGTKMFTSGAAESPCLIVSTRTDPSVSKHKGLAVFLVDRDAPGITCRRIEKLGMRAAGTLCEVAYENVRVPRSALLGGLGNGWAVITGTLERARVAQAAYCVGAAQRTIDDALAHVKARTARSASRLTPQADAHLLVDLRMRTDAARLLLYRAADLIDRQVACVREASIANLHATETLVTVTAEAMRLYGNHGFTRGSEVERMLRDARLFIIGDGSSQIQRNLIARQMSAHRS